MEQQVKQNDFEITYKDIFQKAVVLISKSEKSRKDMIIANFQLGELVSQVKNNAKYGDKAVIKLAEDLSKTKGYRIYPSFLWECARVYQTFKGNLQRIWELEKELQIRNIQLSWTFLVKNCTPIPDPESLEAEAYWEKQITEWEASLSEIEEKIEKKEEIIQKMPPKAREAFTGFIAKLSSDCTIKVDLSVDKKIEYTLKKVVNHP